MLDFLISYGYIGLFVACFLAATLLPLSSDIVFGALIAMGAAAIPCLILASVGNWLGGMTNYYLGYWGKTEWIEKYLKVKKEKIDKMQKWLNKKGAYMAFFSFLPIVGDIIPLSLGYMKADISIVNVSMFMGKFIRYAVILYLVNIGIEVF
jgi:membrane protein YqaA with SNARE-associated domain